MSEPSYSWKDAAIAYSREGLSWRKIATKLEKSKSTVSDFLRSFDKSKENSKPASVKTLLLDLELAPTIAAVWRLWKENVGLDQIREDWYIMSYAAKWLHAEDILYNDCRDSIGDDSQIVTELHNLFSEADIIVCHNVKFDVPKAKARFILNKLPPPKPFKTYCTLEASRRLFNFTSNRLAYLTNHFGSNEKLSHGKFPGFKLWSECMNGNIEAWEEMKKYNIVDVLGLEDVYLTVRPWDDKHPNINTYSPDEVKRCPCCGSDNLTQDEFAFTNTGMYTQYKCVDCGKYSRSRYTLNTNSKRKSLLV